MGDRDLSMLGNMPQHSPHASPRGSVSGPSSSSAPSSFAPVVAGGSLADFAIMQQQMASMYEQMQKQQKQLAAALAQAPVQPSHHGSRIKPPPMTKFTGTVGPEVDTFIRDLKIQFEIYGQREFPDNDSRLRFAGAYMSGTAADWWEKEDKSVLVSWDKFVERLHDRFRPLQAEDNALHRLRNLKQRGHVSQYCSLFLSILTHITDYPMKHQVFDFLEGLASDDVRSRIKQAKPMTLQAAMDMAVSMEEYSKQPRSGFQYRGGYRPSGQSGASSSASTHVPMDINAVHGAADDYESGYDQPESEDKSVGSVVDVIMQKVEARLAALHQPASAQGQAGRGRSNDNGRFGGNKFSAEKERLYNEGKCFKCKKPGHQSRHCPQKDFQ